MVTDSTPKRHCIVTVTTPDFVVGTLVMLDSFFQHNRWFNGDVVVIHNKLPAQQQSQLQCRFPAIRFLQISAEMEGALEQLVLFRPNLNNRKTRFYALEAIRLNDYRRLLFCDSDLLFRGSIEPLFQNRQPLICCGDGIYYWGGGRERESFAQRRQVDCSNPNILCKTFNSGLLLYEHSLLGPHHYSKLMAQLDPERWGKITAPHTDQIVLNRFYAGQQYLAGAEYNYLLGHRPLIFEKCGLTIDAAKVLHFNGRAKPWLTERVLQQTQQDPAYIKAVKYWYNAYIACLQRLHLATVYSPNQA